jgi:hypothetical protein
MEERNFSESSFSKVPTKFMLDLKDKLMNAERPIAEVSANKYLCDILNLNGKVPFKNLKFLKENKDDIMEKLSQYEDTTRHNYLTSIVAVLKPSKSSHLYKTTLQFYSEELKKSKDIRKNLDPSLKTEKQRENWEDWETVMEAQTELKEEVDKFKNNRILTNVQWETLMDLLILSLYTLVEPRRNRDYQDMYIICRRDKVDWGNTDINLLDIDEEKFIFNTYKTSKTYKSQVIDIPEELMEIIRIYIKHYPNFEKASNKNGVCPLLISRNGEYHKKQKSPNYITLKLNKIFGKKIGSSMLRHIFITNKFGNIYEEQAKIANNMAHSLQEQREYIKLK